MQKNNWIVGLVFLLIIVALGSWAFSKSKTSADVVNKVQDVAGASSESIITPNEPYFSNDAKVMYFYQPTCHYCIQQSPILKELATEGYRVKPMDAGTDQTLWQKYNVSGTPTFIGADGEKLVGLQTKETLKAILDKNK